MSVTIVIVTADVNSDIAKRCIESIKKYTKDYELLILDNNYKLNFNHAKEINRALKIANSEYVVLVDDDCLVSEGWLDALLECAKKDEKIGIVGAKILKPSGEIDHTGGYILQNGLYGHLQDVVEGDRECQWVCSALMMVRKGFIDKVGGFDEAFSKYFQDVDIGIRCWQSGYKVVCAPKCIVTHFSQVMVRRIRGDISEIANKDRMTYFQKWVLSGKMKEVFFKCSK